MNSICFDTETTGLHPNGSDPDEILTISIVGRDGSVLLDERFRPTAKTEWPHASAINGIYRRTWQTCRLSRQPYRD